VGGNNTNAVIYKQNSNYNKHNYNNMLGGSTWNEKPALSFPAAPTMMMLPRLPQQPSYPQTRKKFLVLDLDETLVHSNTSTILRGKHDMVVNVTIDNIKSTFYVAKRPHVDRFIDTVGDKSFFPSADIL
jgi:TFIIF-interacting CTD phosphatase-like protein